ncbi:MAG: efflux RND transporter permease subunit [Rhodothermales bacterium]
MPSPLSTLTSRPIATASWSVALLIAGAWAATQVPLEWTPQVELPEIRVAASWPGAAPRQVERYVTAPIERALQRIPGTAEIESFSEENMSTVTVSVSDDVDIEHYTSQLNEQLALLRDVLPERVFPYPTRSIPEALREQVGFMDLQVVGPQEPDVLRRLAEEVVAPKIRSVQGVADVIVSGGTQREVLVTLNSDRLDHFGLDPGRIRFEIGSAIQDRVFGRIDERGRSTLIIQPAEEDIGNIRNIVLKMSDDGSPVRLADIGSVELAQAPQRSITRVDGQSVVSLRVERAKASHLVEVAEGVLDKIEELRGRTADGVRILVVSDRSEDIREEMRDLRWHGGLGTVLVIFVLLFMLKSVRATVVVLLSVSLSMAVAFALMLPLGLTLNLITIAGLVLVFGLLVDNSVVVVEQIMARKSAHGLEPYVDTARHALASVWLPLLGGTLTTAAVMVPLVYLSGELRALFLPFGILVGSTLLMSLVTAGTIVPVLCQFVPAASTKRTGKRRLQRWVNLPYKLFVRFRKTTLLLLVLLLGLPLWKLPTRITTEGPDTSPKARLAKVYNETIGNDKVADGRRWVEEALGGVMRPFFRTVQFGTRWSRDVRPEAYANLRFPPGNTIERADELIARFEDVALASPSVERTVATISERNAYLRVIFKDGTLSTAEPYMTRERMIGQAIGISGIGVSIGGLLPEGYYSGSGGGISGINVEALGPNYEDLELLAERFAAFAKSRSRRVAEVNTNAGRWGYSDDRQVLRLRWDADSHAQTGVSASWLAARMRPVFSTRTPSFWMDIADVVQLPVRIMVDGADELDISEVSHRPMAVGDSTTIRLAGLSDYRVERTPSGIERKNQQYKRYISVDYRGPSQIAQKFMESALEEFAVPNGYTLERRSYSFFDDETETALTWVLLATLMLVYLITAAVFESWLLPLVVLVSVPLAIIGFATGFLWTDAAFAEGAFIGLVLLTGIAVNDAILLTDRYRQLVDRRPNTPRGVLVRLAIRERLRPMWTTTLTSVAAMAPMLIFPDDGDFWLGLAVTVVGGLLSSTLLVPIATAALVAGSKSLRKPIAVAVSSTLRNQGR